jgi:hypothetical protein
LRWRTAPFRGGRSSDGPVADLLSRALAALEDDDSALRVRLLQLLNGSMARSGRQGNREHPKCGIVVAVLREGSRTVVTASRTTRTVAFASRC